eukprot:CCRYP_018925-RA/>CCRYP_018925-RA protein AED:0.49 eAED:0.35 QI:0/-1/0/1/-1/1/1/0/535
MYPIRTVDEIRATFPLHDGRIPPIVGEPTAKELLRVHAALRSCAKSQRSDDCPFGHIYLVEPPAVMATYGAPPFERPTKEDIGPMPTFAGAFLQADVESAKMDWERRNAHRQTIDNIDIALITEFLKTISPDVIEDIETDINAARDETFLQVFDRYWKEYGVATPHEIKQNRDSMEASWNPAGGENFTKVIRQLRDGQRFATYTNNAYSDKQLVQMGEKIVLDTHNFKGDYGKWMKLPEQERTWAHFIRHFGTAYKVWKITDNASGNFGYGGGATDTGEEESWEHIDGINAATNAANAATFQQLSNTNATLTTQNAHLTAQLAILQQQLQHANSATPHTVNQSPYHPSPPPNPPTTPYHPPHPQPPFHHQHTAPTYTPPAPPAYSHQQGNAGYTPPTGGYYERTGRGNRTGRGGSRNTRGRGRGQYRSGNPTGYNSGYQPHQGGYQLQGGYPQQPPTTQPAPSFYRGGHTGSRPPNPVKRHNNMLYCWSHGFDVDHDGYHCNNPSEGHIPWATRDNPCNGCMKKQHKTVLPGPGM